MTYRLLMVCTGNICRSAMAEVILNDRFESEGIDAVVDSAGISAEEHGNPIDYRAQKTLRRAGYEIPDHFAKQVKAHELADYDLILAMTSNHMNWMESLADRAGVNVIENPDVGDPRSTDIRMFRSFDPKYVANPPKRRRELDVPDPWYGDQEDFEITLETIESAADAIVQHVKEQLAK
ncbi:MAG TPA: low molecular weight phosphotyrosine protein phosphatase [Actinomyces sp.]|jgi:protein-tyrosine phosphatase|nr:low molecular weight phosphotyrosine protein phosphatase [Actinomyces sp.]